MITPPWVLDSIALQHIAELPEDQKEYGWATFRHYYYNSYKVPCVATFLIWGLFLSLILVSGLSTFIEHFFPRLHHGLSRKAAWWRGNISEHPLVSQKHSQVVTCGKGCFAWLTFHLPLRLEAIILVAMVALNIVPLVSFYSLYVGHNTYFTGTDAISRRSQILRHLANRCAMLGIGQLPMLILLASKRTPVAILSQLPMNTMMLFHRWIARTCYVHIVIHTLGNALIFHYSIGFVESLKILPVQLGIVAIVMLSGLVFLSLRTLRKRHYEVFVFLHISMALLMIVFTYLHIKYLHQGRLALQIFVIELTAIFWAFDRTVRLLGRIAMSLSWRYADGAGAMRKAELTSYGNGAYTRMRIQVPVSRLRLPNDASSSSLASYIDFEDETKQRLGSISRSLGDSSLLGFAKIGAGDDVRITIPRLQWVGEHPFSVFAVGRCKTGNPDMGYIDLVIQRQAGLTQKLSKLADKLSKPTVVSDRGPSDAYLQRAVRQKGKRVKVAIDGPFGRSPSLEGVRHAVLIAGGIAITFCYPLFVKAARGEFSGLETCKLVWIVRNEAILDVLRDSLPELLDEVRKRGGSRCRLSIDIYVTTRSKASASQPSDVVVVDRRGRLPSRLEPTWESAPPSTLHSSPSSVTLNYGGESWSTACPKRDMSKPQVWDGVRYKRHYDLDLMPTLSNNQSIYQQPPQAAYMQDDIYRTTSSTSSINSPVSFENKFSPSSSQVSLHRIGKDVLEQTLDSTASWQPPSAYKSSRWSPPQSLASTYSARHPSDGQMSLFLGQNHGLDTGREEPEEVLLNYHAQSEAGDGSETPYSGYAESVSSSQYTGYRINPGGNMSTRELQLQSTRSNHSSASSVYSILRPDSPPSADGPPKYLSQQEELSRRLLLSQDVLAETRGGIVEIRRFQGRPSSMAAVHGHITKHGESVAGRTIFATCGPAPMCDSVRAEVVALLKKGADVALVEDCFNW
ncbi:related to FRE6 - Ferric reductase [Ustilago trichophora]|uniref:Related to FRE6 - Ferric reductase n=1 Tax=Ustilago trichophora TaxID=86804 RepID=A0A5C3DXH0_9BASI|nr:related to FRE6 - Ferric reductase [Ustilago trichophora]